MKLQNQVCALEQSKRLVELGISTTGSYFSYQGTVDHEPDLKSDDGKDYPAFTVAELGLMLPRSSFTYLDKGPVFVDSFNGTESFNTDLVTAGNGNNATTILSFHAPTEAISRAIMLQHLLDVKVIGSQEVNNRLTQPS